MGTHEAAVFPGVPLYGGAVLHGRAGRPAGGSGGQRHGGTGPDPHIVLYLHRHLGRSRALGRCGHLLSVGGGDVLAGRSASPSAAALEDGISSEIIIKGKVNRDENI